MEEQKLNYTTTYTVEDEEPICNKCEHCCGEYDCSNNCGPKYGWYGYRRIELNNGK